MLSPYLGQTVKFGASLKVTKGDIVGLTVPTWAPAFAQGQSSSNVWRASRAPGKCTNSTDVRQGQPQAKIGARATYGCRYSTARLLYTATLIEGYRAQASATTNGKVGCPSPRLVLFRRSNRGQPTTPHRKS